jgi:hypothetical protein
VSKDNRNDIIEQLKNLPKIADETDKEKLYGQISSRLEEDKTPMQNKKRNRYIPFLAAAVLIFGISLPFLFMNMNNQTANDVANRHEAGDEEASTFEADENSEITSFSTDADQRTDMIASDIQQSFPEEINVELEIDQDVLILNLNSDAGQPDAEITETMIESILLTAKSYDFQYVSFENMPATEIAGYDFSEAIKVPPQ